MRLKYEKVLEQYCFVSPLTTTQVIQLKVLHFQCLKSKKINHHLLLHVSFMFN